jgi:hypothetical protein
MSSKRGRWSRLLLLTTALAQLGIVGFAPALDAHVSQTRVVASGASLVDDQAGGSVNDAGLCAACAVMHASWDLGASPPRLLAARISERPDAIQTRVAVLAAVRSLQLPRAPPNVLA